jgi:outer membrane protein insertion porin family
VTAVVAAVLAACPVQVPEVASDAGVESLLKARIAQVCVLGAAKDLPVLAARADAGLSFELTQADLEALSATGRFRDARALALPLDARGVTLVYAVEPYPTLENLSVTGSQRVDPSPLFEHGIPLSPVNIRSGLDALVERYAALGFPNTRIDTSLDGGVLALDVREGARLTVRQVRFSGNTHVATPALRVPLRTNAGGAFSATVTAADAQRLVTLLRDRGYLEAAVAPPAARDVSGKPGEIDVVFDVTEGPLYRSGAILVNGWKGKQPLRPVETLPGKPFSPSGAERDVDRLKHQASEQGVEVEVLLLTDVDATKHTVSASFEVTKRKAGVGPF